MEIRLMNDRDDRDAISQIYEESWKFAYKGLIPQDYLDGIPKGNWAKAVDTPGVEYSFDAGWCTDYRNIFVLSFSI